MTLTIRAFRGLWYAVTLSANPRLGGFAKHHPANAGDGQNHSLHLGLTEAPWQQAERAGHVQDATDQSGPDGLERVSQREGLVCISL